MAAFKNTNKTGITSPEFWIEQWKASLSGSVWAGRYGYTSERIWDMMAPKYHKWSDKNPETQRIEKLIQQLKEKNLFQPGMQILDIGCGTGGAAIPFAKHGAHVTALDFSKKMLQVLKESMPADIKSRIKPVYADWEKVNLKKRGWEGAFDLAFASMTPAIRSPETFLKLQRASRKKCYFRGWAGKRQDPLLEDLWKYLWKSPMPTMGWDIILAFNLLYTMDHNPAIEFQHVCWEHKQPVEEAANFFADFFAGFKNNARLNIKAKILEHLNTVAENGFISRKTAGRTAIMVWETK